MRPVGDLDAGTSVLVDGRIVLRRAPYDGRGFRTQKGHMLAERRVGPLGTSSAAHFQE